MPYGVDNKTFGWVWVHQPPSYIKSSNFVRTDNTIVLMADDDYYKLSQIVKAIFLSTTSLSRIYTCWIKENKCTHFI